MLFDELKLAEPLLRAVKAEGYTSPTPIQEAAIPPALEGRDVLGCAQTGTGKTAAFALPILQRLGAPTARGPRAIRCLVLTPTRELATQVGDSFATYGKNTGLKHAVVFGGVGQEPQVRAIRGGLDILVATPGRLNDLIQQRMVSFDKIEVFVLDEADRMLDMGFIHDVKKILRTLPQKRQTLFFSATMPSDIQSLADSILKNPVKVAVTPVATTAETIDQRMYFVSTNDKRSLLVHVLEDRNMKISRAIVFTRTKNGANRVAKHLAGANISADAIHGNKSQNARTKALEGFRTGSVRVLVATDIAARGIDVDGVSHVINFDLPNVPESYVHRIGRTGRAGAAGIALSFCAGEEREYLRDIEKTIRRTIPVVSDQPFHSTAPASGPAPASVQGRRPPNGGRQEARGQGRPGGGGGGGRSGGGRSAGGGRSGGGGARTEEGAGRSRRGPRRPADSRGGAATSAGASAGASRSAPSAPKQTSTKPAAPRPERRMPKWF